MLLFRRRCIKETIENPRTDLSCELKPETGLVFGKSPKPYSRRSKGHLDRGFHRGHSWTNIHPHPRSATNWSRKWDRHFTGPYRVVQQCRTVNYIVQRSARAKPFRIHVDKLRLCHSDTTESVPRTVASQSEYTCQGDRPATTGHWKRNAGRAEHAASPKWDRRFAEPSRVVQQCRTVNCIVQRAARAKPLRVHVDKLRLGHHNTTESALRTVASEGEHTRQEARPATTGHWNRNTERAEDAAAPKWDRHFTGPYRVVQQCGPVNYIVQRSARAKPFRIHVDKLRLCQSDTIESVLEAVAPEEEHTRQRSRPAAPQSQRTATTGRWKRSAGNDEPAATSKEQRLLRAPTGSRHEETEAVVDTAGSPASPSTSQGTGKASRSRQAPPRGRPKEEDDAERPSPSDGGLSTERNQRPRRTIRRPVRFRQ